MDSEYTASPRRTVAFDLLLLVSDINPTQVFVGIIIDSGFLHLQVSMVYRVSLAVVLYFVDNLLYC